MAEPSNQPGGPPPDVVSDYLEGYQQLELQSAHNNLRKTRNTIFVIAGLIVVSNLIMMGANNSFTTVGLIMVGILAAVFVGLGLLTKKAPLTAVIIALVLFVGLWVLDVATLGMEYLTNGLIAKAVIIYFLVRGIKYARETERIRKELKRFQSP